MAQKIQPEDISKIAEKIIKQHAYKNGVYLHLPIHDGISLIAADYFWLGTYKILIKAGLIDKNLNVSEFMLKNGFAVTWHQIEEVDVDTEPIELDLPPENDYLTCMGFDFLMNLMQMVSNDNQKLIPPGESGSWTEKIEFIKCYHTFASSRGGELFKQ